MIEQDKRNFMNMMNAVTEMYDQPNMGLDIMRVWFSKLQHLNFKTVSQAFDIYTSKHSVAPTINDILKLCPAKSEFTKIAPPKMAKEESKEYSEKMLYAIEKAPKPTTDPKAWAKKIIANPKNYPSISLKTAKEALSTRDVRV
jgi:hypothetical protein